MRIAMFEGYGSPGRRRRRKRRSSSGQKRAQSKLARAARACKGRKKGAFRACIRAKLKRGR